MRARDFSFSRLFGRFALTGLLAIVLIGIVGFVLIRQSATASAIRQAKELTALGPIARRPKLSAHGARAVSEVLGDPMSGQPAKATRRSGSWRDRQVLGSGAVREPQSLAAWAPLGET